MLMHARTPFLRSRPVAAASGYSALTWRSIQKIQTYADGSDSWTFTALPIGTANSLRTVLVAAVHPIGNVPTAVTVGGVSATPLTGSVVSMWSAAVPTGTTANIVVQNGAGWGEPGVAIGYWTVNNAALVDLNVAASGTGVVTAAIGIPANGFCISASNCFEGSDIAHSIDASFTERGEDYIDTFPGLNFSCSDRAVTTAQVGLNVTSSWSVTNTTYIGLVSGQ